MGHVSSKRTVVISGIMYYFRIDYYYNLFVPIEYLYWPIVFIIHKNEELLPVNLPHFQQILWLKHLPFVEDNNPPEVNEFNRYLLSTSIFINPG